MGTRHSSACIAGEKALVLPLEVCQKALFAQNLEGCTDESGRGTSLSALHTVLGVTYDVTCNSMAMADLALQPSRMTGHLFPSITIRHHLCAQTAWHGKSNQQHTRCRDDTEQTLLWCNELQNCDKQMYFCLTQLQVDGYRRMSDTQSQGTLNGAACRAQVKLPILNDTACWAQVMVPILTK